MSSGDDIVVSGVGVVSSAGCGSSRLAAALERGRPSWFAAPTHPLLVSPQPVPITPADESELGSWVEPRVARRMSRPSKLALAAAKMACAEARFDPATETTASIFATAFGTASFAEELVKAIQHDPQSASPFHFSESVANAPAAQVAIQLGARGTNVAITQREAGPWLAVGAAVREVTLGRASHALAGGVDELNPLVPAVLSRFRATASLGPAGEPGNLPFDSRRSGFLPAEGSVCLVVERAQSARARGIAPVARVRGCGRAFDPSATAWSWGTGAEHLATAIRASLANIGLVPRDLGAWIASASGSRAGDTLEAEVLGQLFGAGPRPPLLTPKWTVGEYAGLALGAALLHLGGAPSRRPDDWLGDPALRPHVGTIDGPVLSLALACGGAAAWVVLERPRRELA